MAALHGALGVMGVEGSDNTHPFFQQCPILHRALKSKEAKDDGDSSSLSQPTKRKVRPLVEHRSTAHPLRPSVDGGEQTIAKSPTTKVVKLNANGKLLSSPPIGAGRFFSAEGVKEVMGSPITMRGSRKRTRQRHPNPRSSSSLIAKISYGLGDLETRRRVGRAIDELFVLPEASAPPSKSFDTKGRTTHPFFLDQSKPRKRIKGSDAQNGHISSHDARPPSRGEKVPAKKESPPAKKVPAWKDIVFSSGRSEVLGHRTSLAPWPPTNTQRVDGHDGNLPPDLSTAFLPFSTYKFKGQTTNIPKDQDIISLAARTYFEKLDTSRPVTSQLPARKILTGQDMADELDDGLPAQSRHPAIQRLLSFLATSSTAFDQGKCEQFSWNTKSSPCSAAEVLQPRSEAEVLRDWVRNLAVVSIEGAQPADKVKPSKPRGRKRGVSKRSDALDDFIVSSEDEDDELTEVDQSSPDNSPFVNDAKRTVLRTGAIKSGQTKTQLKNAVIISGPSGCGKTASIYAIAKELGFEVFEIHPGTRRAGRDILERVGDMTRNHLVQQQDQDLSAAESSEVSIDNDSVREEIASGKQSTMNGFFRTQSKPTTKVQRKRKAVPQTDAKDEESVKKARKAQKQSLILVEEVDILFEEDKAFWSGVMSLIEQSKRPIILTCNDETSLPLKELPLHGILRYSSVPEGLATDYLLTLAASEGHDLQRDAVATLYRSTGYDLRAAISELHFWCQMGVGSHKGGLDWMLDRRTPSTDVGTDDVRQPRVFSSNTYVQGMGVLPHERITDPDHLLYLADEQLDIPIASWCSELGSSFPDTATVQSVSASADSHSDLDLYHHAPLQGEGDPSDLHLRIAVSLTNLLLPAPPTQATILDTYLRKKNPEPSTKPLKLATMLQILSPLQTSKLTFLPPPPGRPAPTLDSPRSSVITDLAPYIRSIVAFEEKWGATGLESASTSMSTKRSTRANASSSHAGHFPQSLNAKHVLMTGGDGWQDLDLGRQKSDG